MLGCALGVPIPEFAVFETDDRGRGWLSEFVADGQHWSRARAHALDDHGDLGRMLALDAIIHNEDRNTENILFQPLEEPGRFRCWVIDNEAALISRPRELASKGLTAPRPFALPPDFAAEAGARHVAHEAASRAQSLSESLVQAIAHTAAEVAGTLDREVLAQALVARCRHATQIVEQYLDQVPRG
jgi:hypothetical protein